MPDQEYHIPPTAFDGTTWFAILCVIIPLLGLAELAAKQMGWLP